MAQDLRASPESTGKPMRAGYEVNMIAPVTQRPVEIAIVVPTFNERDNVLKLKELLSETLKGRVWELVFVDDDSKDGTYDVLAAEARLDPRMRVIRRIGRRGLATAVVEGILSTTAPIVAVMDADLQHDERVLPDMIAKLDSSGADLVVGSRYTEGGGLGDWNARRRFISKFATDISRLVVKADLTDPMSGFFLIRREAFERAVRRLSGQGYKILLDIVASARPPLKVAETPYTFRNRQHGESKLDSAVTWEYLMLVADKLFGHIIPVRFVMFMAVGGAGVVVHMAILTALYQMSQVAFLPAQTVATVAAMTFNFFVNNTLTYRDKRRKGLVGLTVGLLSFYAVCSIGAVANVGIAAYLHDGASYSWWLSAVAGILVGAVWNYAASSIFTWRK
jgi:dolichol-phosphate mannosyltransferase